MKDARASAAPATGRLTALVANLIGRRPPVVERVKVPAVPQDPRITRLRRLYDDIGAFLFDNRLDLTPLNFGCAHDYLTGSDHEVERAVGLALREHSVTNGWIESFFDDRPDSAIKPEALHAIAETVEKELASYISLVTLTRESTHDYGAALEAEAGASSVPLPIVERLIALTRDMVERTRETEIEMRKSEKMAQHLRSTLRKAQRAAEIDHLTDLPNRRAFESQLQRACAASAESGGPLCVVLCDIDHFKAINDGHGHDTGDRVLKFIATELHDRLRGVGLVSRFGGEEFAIIFEKLGIEESALAVDRFRERLSARKFVDQSTDRLVGQISFSAGVAQIAIGEDPKVALKRADTALYSAKQCGRNRVYVSTDTLYVGPPKASAGR